MGANYTGAGSSSGRYQGFIPFTFVICCARHSLAGLEVVMGLLWEVVPVSNDVAESVRVVAQHVSDLPARI